MAETESATTAADSLTADILATIREIEADAEAVVSQARREADELVARAVREADGRRKSAAELAAREAEIRVREAVAAASAEAAGLREKARKEMYEQRDGFSGTRRDAVDAVIARLIPRTAQD